jgi:hypothetical protein
VPKAITVFSSVYPVSLEERKRRHTEKVSKAGVSIGAWINAASSFYAAYMYIDGIGSLHPLLL